MSFLNWSNYLRRKSRTARNSFNFSNRSSGDTVDWGNGKSYKFDGKRWKKIEEQEELEIQITDDPAEVSESVLPSAIAISTLKDDTETADNLKADKTMSNVDSVPSSKLTGALPALDGSALTGLSATKVQATAPSSPELGDLWLNNTVNPHVFKIYNKLHDGTSDWDTVFINRMPVAASITASVSSMPESQTQSISFSGATDADIGGTYEGTGLTWEVTNVSNTSLITSVSPSSVVNSTNPSFTFTSAAVSANTDVTYDVEVTDSNGLVHTKTGLTIEVRNEVSLSMSGYTHQNHYYNSGTVSHTVGSITIPSGMTLDKFYIDGYNTGSNVSNYIDWIQVGGVTIHSGNISELSYSNTLYETNAIDCGSGSKSVVFGVQSGYESYDRLYIDGMTFIFS